MAAGVSGELSELLQKIVDTGTSSDKDGVLYHLIEDVSKICLGGVSKENAGLILSIVLGEKNSILSILRDVSSHQPLKRSTLASLDLLCGLIKKYGAELKKTAGRIKTTCLTVYTKTNVAAVKSQSLQALIELLQCTSLKGSWDDLAEVAKKFLSDLAKGETYVKATVKREILVLLGVLCVTSPSSLNELSDSIAEKVISLLNHQMTRTKSPDTAIIAGCFLSLTRILCNFDRSGFPEQVSTIFNCICKAVDPSIKITRYDVPRSALELLAKRGEQFRSHLLGSYKDVYGRLIEFTRSKNEDVRKAAAPAIETFLRQVGAELADPMDDSVTEEKRKEIFNFFLRDFMTLMKATTSTLGSVSRAIRSYGYFAAAFRKFKGEEEVRDMLVILLEKCYQVCMSEEETSDSKAAFLPSFLQSLASIIKETYMVDESVSESLGVIFKYTLEFYPKLTGPIQLQCSYAIVQFLYTVCAMKQRPVKLLSDLVYQLLLQTCFHPPVVEGETSVQTTEDDREVVSYKGFTSLWVQLLTLPQEQKSRIGVSGVSELKGCIYGEAIRALLRMCEKLNLDIIAEQEDDETQPERDANAPMTREPVKIKDFQILINIAAFMKAVMEDTETIYFTQWAYIFCHTIIKLSSQKPAVSSFYKLLTSAMAICSVNDYFKPIYSDEEEGDDGMDILSDTEGAAVFVTYQLICKYEKKVVLYMKQYKDDLLISCLKFILSLPECILKGNLEATSETLQMGLSLGLSYHPLIGECLPTLRLLCSSLPEEDLIPQLRILLPYLDRFLQDTDQLEEGNGEETTRKVLKNKQRLKLPPSLLRLANEKTQSGKTEVQRLKLEVLKFLGELGGNRNQYMINNDRRDLAKLAVSWDTKTHLLFDLPFKEMKVDIYLDMFLPRACELSLSSSNRQTKVAACELVHSLVLLLLGRSVNQTEDMQKKKPAHNVYKKLFPVILNLAVDIELVASQLFKPLMMQLIHWFTRFPKRRETSLLLETLMEGVETINNSALREFSAECVKEFLKWSIKQTSLEKQRKKPENVKQLLIKMYSMARHPSSSRRLGACNVYNHIYTLLREEDSLVDQFTMEILVCFVECLAIAHGDDSSLGTRKEAEKCLNHVERILKKKFDIFYTPSKDLRRLPTNWTHGTLKEAILWLFNQVGRPETDCRHSCMHLITNLIPVLPPELRSKKKLMDSVIEKHGIQYLRDRCEAVPLKKDGKAGLSQQAIPFQSQDSLTLKACIKWFESILACLDAYCWLIGTDMVSASSLLTGDDKVFSALTYFVDNVSMRSLDELSQDQSDKPSVYTPAELEEFNRCKCTVTVRLFDFLTVLSSKEKQILSRSKLLTAKLWTLVGQCIFKPTAVGFNMADIEILSNLPEILKTLLCVMERFLDTAVVGNFHRTMIDLTKPGGEYDLHKMSLSLDMTCTEETHLATTRPAAGYQLLSDAKILTKCLLAKTDLSLIGKQLADTVTKASTARVIEPTAKCLLEALFKLSLSIGVPVPAVLDSLFGECATAFYACVDTVLQKHMAEGRSDIIKSIIARASNSPHQTASCIIGLLDYCRTSSQPQKQKQAVTQTILDEWPQLRCWWSGSTSTQTTVSYCICVLRKSLLIDSVVEKRAHYGLMMDFFKSTLSSEQTEHSQRCDLLDALPIFLKGTAEQNNSIRECIQNYMNARFPLSSSELPINSSGYHDYMTTFIKILEAMVLGGDPELLRIVLTVLCREEKHAQEGLIQDYIARFANRLRRLHSDRQLHVLSMCFNMFNNPSTYPNQTIRIAALTRICLPMLRRVDKPTVIDFFTAILGDIKGFLSAKESKGSPDALEVVIRDKICCYKLIEFMYNTLSKDEVFNAGSSLAHIWLANDPTAAAKSDAWKNMTKDLIRMSKDCKNEDMRGETIHLELRRKLHCFAFNALMAIIANTQVNPDFYRSFIFSGDSIKGCTPLENICPEKLYEFEIELTKLPTRSKRLVSVRQLNDAGDNRDDITYMQTVAESSLTEDLSKYDFSYSQSLATSRQKHEDKEQEQLELLYPDRETVGATTANISQGYVEFESDILNEHECMASFISLLRHMYDNEITPTAADEQDDLPGWMLWLKGKLDSSTTPVNVKHFIARLILNTEKVFSPFAHHWLSSLVNYITACCKELHYFAMDVIVMIIVWCDAAEPQKEPVGKAMLNKLTQHIMSMVHHERTGIFRNNLDLIKNCLERWRTFIIIDTSIITTFLKSTDDEKGKKMLTGVQLMGVVIANKIEPYNASQAGSVGKQEFYCSLAKCLTNRLLSVYSSAAEVLGLTFNYLSSNSDVNSNTFLLQYEEFVEKGLSSPNIPVHKLIVCLYSINRHHPSFSDKFLSKVLFEVKRLHGDMRQKALEVIASRIAHTESPYEKLVNIDFSDLLAHRNDHIMESCLKIFSNVLVKLTPQETSTWLPLMVKCQSTGNAACRQLCHTIFMNVYSTYRSKDVAKSEISLVKELLSASHEQLLIALSDDSQPNRLLVQNYWSADSIMSEEIMKRLDGILNQMYSTRTESTFLGYATNLILELTSKSTDFDRAVFATPLSDTKFTDYAINSTWSQRYSSLAPMFAEGTMSQSAASLDGGMLRGTQATQQFEATQDLKGQKAFNWLTQSSLDASLDATASMTESSSLMFTVGKKPSAQPRPLARPSTSSASRREQAATREVTRGTNPELSALRRRFIKDQESSRIFFARRESRRKKMEEERMSANKSQRENQVTLYRQYRMGDLPDIQIKYSAVISPLQAVAQKDSSTARMLFHAVFKAILCHSNTDKDVAKNMIGQIENVLKSSTNYHPPLMACFLDLLNVLSELSEPSFDSAIVSDCSIQCRQQPVGVVALEHKLTSKDAQVEEPKTKRRKTALKVEKVKVDDPQTWIDMARLYKSMGNYDIVRGIMTEHMSVHALTKQALEMEAQCNYEQAANHYESVLGEKNPEELCELSLIDDGRLYCLEQLASWGKIEDILMVNLNNDLNGLWADASKDYYLKAYMKCQTRKLMEGGDNKSFLKFINDSCQIVDQRSQLEVDHSEELAIVYMAKKEFERARHYYRLSCEKFLYEWSTLGQLMVDARAYNVQTMQRLTEMGEFLGLIDKISADAAGNMNVVVDKVDEWILRSPGDLYSTSCWDSVVANRVFYTQMLESKFSTVHFGEQRLDMRLNQATQAASTGNLMLAANILRSTHKDKSEADSGVQVKLKWSAVGMLIKHRLANVADLPLATRIKNISAAARAMDRHSNAEVDAAVETSQHLYYQWYSLKGKTWSCLLSGILDSTDDERQKCEEELFTLVKRSSVEQVVIKVCNLSLGSINKSLSTRVTSQISQAHIDMVIFADYLLRYSEEGTGSLVGEHLLGGLKDHMITSCTKALNMGSVEALAWVPRLLQLIELYPEIIPQFVEKTKEVPSWMFISWISQMVALLDHEHGSTLHHIVMDIAERYPMAIIYPFKISQESYTFKSTGKEETSARQFVSRLSDLLSKHSIVDTFIRALEQLSQPDALFTDWFREWKDLTDSPNFDPVVVESKYQEMYNSLFNQSQRAADQSLYEDEYIDFNCYRKQFSKAFADKVEKSAGRKGEKLSKSGNRALKKSLGTLETDMKKFAKKQQPPSALKDYSTWLARFSADTIDYQIEIPGQYGRSFHKPIPENHVMIAGFDEKLLVLKSLRKPKCVEIRGNDEKDYKFLVKGGEDLRLDQRIQTISNNINRILASNTSCRYLSLTTYQVIPMNARLGLIEWMENVVTLKDLLEGTRTEDENRKYINMKQEYQNKHPTGADFITGYDKFSESDFRDWAKTLMDRSPSNLLSRALHAMSQSVESYYMLRDHCVTSHAVLCVCQYLLGIGDRHLSNFMMDTTSGGMVGIDFGCAFGSATSLLPVPELVPFRLTKLFVELMEPYGTNCLFESTMVNVLRLLRDNRRQMLNLLDIFVKEPSLDWMQNAKRQMTKATFDDEDDSPASEEATASDWYPREKVRFAKLKLLGAHPRYITAEELRLNTTVKSQVGKAVAHVLSNTGADKDLRLSVEEQVKSLINHASDANLICRIWYGWEPLV